MCGKNGRYALYDIKRIAYVDIESTNLKASIGHTISIVSYVREVVPHDKIIETRSYCITRKEIDETVKRRGFNPDKRILTEFFMDLDDVDLVIGHWSHGRNRFDWPFLRGRAMVCEVDDLIPIYGQLRYGDTWAQSKNAITIHSHGLDALGHIMGAPVEKTRLSPQDWWLGGHGDKKSLEYILDHNIKDCKITHKVHKKLERFNSIPGGLI